MAKLNQIIAIEKDVSSKSNRVITDASQTLQKPAPLSGISRSYRPKDEEGDQLPSGLGHPASQLGLSLS
ncbi:MAG: hypothetical protein F6J96_21525 [Symploca sp. SIO1C2]|nr:hypothetical protein [Symploca sp. SIO1C2]